MSKSREGAPSDDFVRIRLRSSSSSSSTPARNKANNDLQDPSSPRISPSQYFLSSQSHSITAPISNHGKSCPAHASSARRALALPRISSQSPSHSPPASLLLLLIALVTDDAFLLRLPVFPAAGRLDTPTPRTFPTISTLPPRRADGNLLPAPTARL